MKRIGTQVEKGNGAGRCLDDCWEAETRRKMSLGQAKGDNTRPVWVVAGILAVVDCGVSGE